MATWQSLSIPWQAAVSEAPEICPILERNATNATALYTAYQTMVIIVEAPTPTTAVSRDPDDDHVLACALAANADIIISGDSDLLALGEFEGIRILTAIELL